MEQGYTCMDGSSNLSLNGSVSLSSSPSGAPVATYSNQPTTHDYLTPTSPVSDGPPQLPAFPPSFNRTQSQPVGSEWPRELRFPRADSGIESDVPRSPVSLSPTNTTNPHASTLYEYIDPKDVDVQERHPADHSTSSTARGESSSSGISSTAPYTSDVTSDNDEGFSLQDNARRRVNPMYEALENSATRLYAQTCHGKVQSSTQKQLRYLWCALITTAVITLILLSVIAFMLFHLIPGIQDRVQKQEDKLHMTEAAYGQLQENANGMAQVLQNTSYIATLHASADLVDRVTQLNSSVWMLTSDLHQVNADLLQQISNISLTPGPQGPPGVGNMSSCEYTNRTSYQALPGPYSTTPYLPSIDILQDNIVMSATCAVIGGTQQFAETRVLHSSMVQYRCRCDGEVDGYDRRACTIHLVTCPRLSVMDLSDLAA